MSDRIGKNLINALNRVVGGLGSTMSTLAKKAVPHIRQRTRRGISDTGAPFAKYTRDYLRRKKTGVNLYGNSRLSRSQVRMLDTMGIVSEPTSKFDSIGGGNTGRFRSRATGQFVKGSVSSLEIGFTDPVKAKIAKYHQTGRKTDRNKMPPRPFMGLEKDFVGRTVSREFKEVISKAFGAGAVAENIKARII